MRIKEGYILYESSGNNVVFHKGRSGRTRGVLQLNSSGVILWKMLEAGASAVTLAETMRDRFGISPEQATSDVKSFLSSLISAGVVEN